MRFVFRVSLADDVWNWHETAVKKGMYGQNWRSYWPKDLTLKVAKDKAELKKYLAKKYYKKEAVNKYAEWLQVAVDPKIIDKVLFKIMGKHVPFKEVQVTITTSNRCPYDSDGGMFFVHYCAAPNWIYKTATHECMHFIIHKYYWQKMIEAGLSDSQAHDIKEALTILLDDVFINRYKTDKDKGYPNHINLRKDIKRISNSTKDFDEIMKKSIKLYQRKYFDQVS